MTDRQDPTRRTGGAPAPSQPSLFRKSQEEEKAACTPPYDFPAGPAVRLGGAGLLTDRDLEDLSVGARRVYLLMKDGEWHHPDAICRAAGKDGAHAREGLRRMRELRDLPGHDIERKRVTEGRLWAYRLIRVPGI